MRRAGPRPPAVLLMVSAALVIAAGGAASVAEVPPAPGATPGLEGTPAPRAPIVRLRYEVLDRRPHDVTAWTQGLVMDAAGRLFEGTGIIGRSQLRELDPLTGEVLRSVPTPHDAYGEGLALVGEDLLVQITWQEGLAFAWAKDSFELVDTFRYAGEGWGLCHDGDRLVMSDGSDRLTFRDPVTFAELGSVAVTVDDRPVVRLNELECHEGEVWANLWQTDTIVRIDPGTGAVTGVLDMTGLLEPHPVLADPGAVLNGISKVPGTDTWLVTGKRWPQLIEVRITEP